MQDAFQNLVPAGAYEPQQLAHLQDVYERALVSALESTPAGRPKITQADVACAVLQAAANAADASGEWIATRDELLAAALEILDRDRCAA